MCIQRVATYGAIETVEGYQISEATCVQREAVGVWMKNFYHPILISYDIQAGCPKKNII